MVSRIMHMPYEQAVKRYLVQPDRDDQRQRVDGGARIQRELGAAA